MRDTSPPNLSTWSGLPAPECCLANRSPVRMCSERLQSALEETLSRRLNGRGSTIYQTGWKPHVTPLGRSISRLRASAPRTSGSAPSSEPSAMSGWPTPCTPSGGRSVSIEKMDATGRTADGKKHTASLEHAAKFAGWPTATARDWKDTAGMATEAMNPDGSTRTRLDHLPRQAQMAVWPTPKAADEQMARRSTKAAHRFMERPQKSSELGIECHQVIHGQPARFTASGEILTGCSAGMESGGQLNPRFSGWLMGYPDAWCLAALSCQLPTRSRKAEKTPAA